MPAKAFVIAMAADIARSDYAKPTLVRSRGREWLIACRWGPKANISRSQPPGPLPGAPGLSAPDGISPIHSMMASWCRSRTGRRTSTFLLLRQLPQQIELAGTFFPADGYVLLQQLTTSG